LHESIYDVLALPLPERELIARIRSHVSRSGGRPRPHPGPSTSILVGIGDDASVLRFSKDRDFLVTTDFSLEGVHFRRDWHPPESVGHRCLARGLSDIAAMGGDPIAAFLSLALPAKLPQRWVDGFLEGFLSLARRFNVPLAGGDTAESPAGVLADIVVVGSVRHSPTSRKSGEKWGTAVLRSGARSGDRIFVSGQLGGSAAALAVLRSGKRLNPKDFPRHFFPEPRIDVGRALREKRIATSMIDLSDGLSTDVSHLCEQIGFGAEIWQNSIPRATIGKGRQVDLKYALHGGEAYELLFTAAPKTHVPSKIAGVQITEVGQITRGRRIILREASGATAKLEPRGWEHFRS
jgi:thiamine-monophosphate kinase